MDFNEHSVICTYRVKPGAREAFIALLKKHWPALRAAGLATETPPLIFESAESGKPQHDEAGVTFVEIFSWASADAPGTAHQTPGVMAVWEPMGGLVESRDGRPAMEFPHYRPVDLATA